MAARGRSRRAGRICRGGWSRSRWWAGWVRLRRGGCCWRAASGCGRSVRAGVEPPAKREAVMSGQLALAFGEQTLVAAAVWEALPPERRLELTLRLARLLARLLEAERDGERQKISEQHRRRRAIVYVRQSTPQ